jgi:hypothetical protein
MPLPLGTYDVLAFLKIAKVWTKVSGVDRKEEEEREMTCENKEPLVGYPCARILERFYPHLVRPERLGRSLTRNIVVYVPCSRIRGSSCQVKPSSSKRLYHAFKRRSRSVI